jgi:hypothetical protein
VAAESANILRNFYLVKNIKIANNSTVTKERENEHRFCNPKNFSKNLNYV